MNIRVTTARRLLLGAALFLGLVTTACAPIRTGVGWPDISLVSDGKNIFVAYNDRIDLIDPATGSPVALLDSEGAVRRQDGEAITWQLNGGENRAQFFSAPVVVDEETLLVADYNKRLWLVNYAAARIDNPTTIEFEGRIVGDITLDEATASVYVPLSENNLVALETENYDVRWIFETERGIWSKPLVIDGVVYFTSMDHRFYAVDAETGEQIWILDLEGAAPSTPLYDVERERFYVGSFAGKVFEVSLQGDITAEYKTEDWVWNTPVLLDGILYTADLGGYVYALNMDGLTEVWKTKATDEGIRPAPVVADDFVVVAARNGLVVWLNRGDGTLAFEEDVDAEILSDILLVEPGDGTTLTDAYIIVSTTSRSRLLVAFRLSDGLQRWTYSR